MMVALLELIVNAQFVHYLGFLIGLFSFLVVFLDLRILLDTNWDVFTSRIFLKKESSLHTITNITAMISAALLLLTTSHLVRVVRGNHVYADILAVGATASLTTAMLLSYFFKRDLAHKPKSKSAQLG